MSGIYETYKTLMARVPPWVWALVKKYQWMYYGFSIGWVLSYLFSFVSGFAVFLVSLIMVASSAGVRTWLYNKSLSYTSLPRDGSAEGGVELYAMDASEGDVEGGLSGTIESYNQQGDNMDAFGSVL